jgi:excisionase family DNA binding protein
MEDMVTVEQAAAIIGLTEGRIRQLIRADELPAVRVGKRTYLINRADLEKIKERPKRGPKPRKGGA